MGFAGRPLPFLLLLLLAGAAATDQIFTTSGNRSHQGLVRSRALPPLSAALGIETPLLLASPFLDPKPPASRPARRCVPVAQRAIRS